MTTDGGGWTLVEWVIDYYHDYTTAASEDSLYTREVHAKIDDSDIQALGENREALIADTEGTQYVLSYGESTWSSLSSTSWANHSYTSKNGGGSTTNCNGHYNNRGFSTYSDLHGSACPTVYSGSTKYMVTWHTHSSSGGVGGEFGVYVR